MALHSIACGYNDRYVGQHTASNDNTIHSQLQEYNASLNSEKINIFNIFVISHFVKNTMVP